MKNKIGHSVEINIGFWEDREICEAALNIAERVLSEAESTSAELKVKLGKFKRKYSGEPDEVFLQANEHAAELEQIRSRVYQLTRERERKRFELERLLRGRLDALREWGLTRESEGSAERMLGAIRSAYERALAEVEGLNLDALRFEQRRLNERIRTIEDEIHEIDEAVKRVEELVIADAMVIATTLTRAYLRDTIQSRRFDTVILDEASMAPIPALWIAASLAEANAVVVGDYKQLPPIVLSKHDLALKWLGRDIFDEAGLSGPNPNAPHLVELRCQYRMHPDISSIPNTLVYDGLLEDGESTKNESSLTNWYRYDWGYDKPVLLVDTGSVGAWVTSVPRGGRSSRLNFLSATICVDLAEQLLRPERPKWQPGNSPRILIICPYRPHAQLLGLLTREGGSSGEVMAGTAHNFQGSQADVVILDLVNDEPHWRVGMFMPDLDDNTMRLLNVALTRAKRRLIIVGDFDYIAKCAPKAFVGTRLIPFLRERYPCVDALDVVPAGLSARAAKAVTGVSGGEVEPDDKRIVVTQDRFYRMLSGDLARSRFRVVIYSAFVTHDRLSQIGPQLLAAVERRVRVYVITKAQSERKRSELSRYRMLEESLIDWGMIVIHKRGMHEKLIFIDDDILWTGSLNPLSFRDTQEVMERRASRAVVADFSRTIRLDDLLSEYEAGRPECPICGGEVVASEGRGDPFFWRCVEDDCYTRGLDQPRLEGGIVVCAKCNGRVEYGEWGGKPAWRCIENRRHHQRIARTHLRLPKMRAIMPKQVLRELDKQFGINTKPPTINIAQIEFDFGS